MLMISWPWYGDTVYQTVTLSDGRVQFVGARQRVVSGEGVGEGRDWFV
jgi:hypothetical protein